MDIKVDRSFRRYPRHIKEVPNRPDTVKNIAKLKLDAEPKAGSPVYVKVLILFLIITIGLAIACGSCLLLGRGFFCLNSTKDWSGWSKCSNLCGIGNQTRHRPSSDGKSTETEVRQCVDGSGCNGTNVTSSMLGAVWSSWSKWSSCSTTCDKGTQTRTRQCRSGTATRQILDSTSCQPGENIEKQDCFSINLCVPYAWTHWGDWSQCAEHCINQTRIRTRKCSDGKSSLSIESSRCPTGIDKQSESCGCHNHPIFFNYHNITGLNCINSQYIRDLKDNLTLESCGNICDNLNDCQAFTMHSGHCKVFVFNRCSKKVRSCSCKYQATFYVKRKAGLKPGALCPAGYSHQLCGVKYKLLKTGLRGFDANLARCNSEPGLVILAELMDFMTLWHFHTEVVPENKHYAKYAIGGRQKHGSPEPAGGWLWWTCRHPINQRLWTRGKPDDTTGAKNIASLTHSRAKLTDKADTSTNAICECLSPFESNKI